jgi:GT2 family glycosyltransferase
MHGRYALLLNTDTVLIENALETLLDFMETNPHAGFACGQLLNEDGTRQNASARFPSLVTLLANESVLNILFPRRCPGKRRFLPGPVEVDSCIGACMMVRRKTIQEIGLLDERYFFFMEETDWAYRAKKAGWGIYLVPEAKIIHYQGRSVGQNPLGRKLFYQSRYQYFRKWQPALFPLIRLVILARLAVNATLTGCGVLLTAGLAAGLRKKMMVYLHLLHWHLTGCPPVGPGERNL